MQIAFGLIMLLFVLIFSAGWIALIISGIVRLRKGRRKQGIIMTSIGGIWGLIAIAVIAAMAIQTRSTLKELEETPFDSLTYAGPKGDISLPYKGESRLVVNNREAKKFLALQSSDGIFIAPAGFYNISSYEIFLVKQQDGKYFTAACYFDRKSENSIHVKTNEQTKVDIGPPLTGFIESMKVQGNFIKLTLLITDTAGNRYILKNPTFEPSFVVIDKAGKAIWEGIFKHSYGSSYVFSSDIPSSVKGGVIFKPVLPKSSFKIGIKETKTTL
jgi:hypothetical protein